MRLHYGRICARLLTIACLSVVTILYVYESSRAARIRRRPRNFVSSSRELFPADGSTSDRILEQMDFVPAETTQRTLSIHLADGTARWGVAVGSAVFEACPVSNCRLSARAESAAAADAVVFRDRIRPPTPSDGMPVHPSHQVWIYYTLESPKHIGSLASHDGLINWTATYRWDSDIVTPYERFTLYEQFPFDQRPRPWPPPARVDKNFARGKTKLVAWFVSNCQSSNKREAYVAELRRHVAVDVFGKCGSLQCKRDDYYCAEMLRRDYKFYLSFENSNCRDYITEKFFVNALQNDVVPVVMGASRAEYERAAPPHSFIHVDDFASAAGLAARLLALAADDAAYNAYFAWKGSGAFIDTKFWCRLCALLHDPPPKLYAHLDSWWRGEGVCPSADPLGSKLAKEAASKS